MDRPKIDVAQMIRDSVDGAEVVGPGSAPNRVKVKIGSAMQIPGTAGMYQSSMEQSDQVVEIDTSKMFKDFGFDPAQVDFQIGSKGAPLEDSPLGFKDRVLYEVARTPTDKFKFLREKYGAENVHFDTEANRFRVKSDNAWYDADATGLTGFLGEEGDVIAGAIGGAAAGTALFPGVGTAAGAAIGAVGAGLGAFVARATTMGAAKAIGLRTEQDAVDVAQELGKEFLLGLGGEAAGLALKGGVNAVKAMNRSVHKLGTNPMTKYEAAKIMTDGIGIDMADSMTWLDHTEAVEGLQKQVIGWQAAGGRGVNPIQQSMADDVQSVIETAKSTMYDDYDKAITKLKPQLKNVEVDMAPVLQDMFARYKDLGLIDEQGRWLKAGEAEIQKVIEAPGVNKLRKGYDIMRRATNKSMTAAVPQTSGAVPKVLLPFEEVQTLIRNFDEMLEASGHYKTAALPGGVTTPAKAQLVNTRSKLSKQAGQSLADYDKSGKLAQDYASMNGKYSKRREWLDDMAYSTGDERVDGTIKNMLGPNGDRSRERMLEILADTGLDATKFMDGLYQKRAAVNTATMFNKPSAGRGLIKATWRRLPIVGAAPERKAPMTAKMFNRIQKMAQRNEFVRTMPESQRRSLLDNPVLLRSIMQTTSQAISTEDALSDQLVEKAIQQTEPVK